jgi:hypothetical protein
VQGAETLCLTLNDDTKRMKPFNKTIFKKAIIIFFVLLVPSFLAAWGRDEGTLPESSYWYYFARLFDVLRFPTHTLMWSVFSNLGALGFFGGMLLNSCFYGLIIERLFSLFKAQQK